jgi:hypothetical protein
MGLSGYLSEYSVAEVLQLIHQSSRTGLLSIFPDNDSVREPVEPTYIWFQGGRLVSLGNSVDTYVTIETIEQRRWLTDAQITSVRSILPMLQQPLGLYLKSLNVLSPEQLKLLFNAQVVHPAYRLFKLRQGRFEFDPLVPMPKSEMTGLSAAVPEVNFVGLRVLKDWSGLSDKLPDSNYGLTKLVSELPAYRLEHLETKVFERANGKETLVQIAEKIDAPVAVVQQIAFRMTVTGLLKEVVIESTNSTLSASAERELAATGSQKKIESGAQLSNSFLGNLMGFLKKKELK